VNQNLEEYQVRSKSANPNPTPFFQVENQRKLQVAWQRVACDVEAAVSELDFLMIGSKLSFLQAHPFFHEWRSSGSGESGAHVIMAIWEQAQTSEQSEPKRGMRILQL
jgi:hypothetical protein